MRQTVDGKGLAVRLREQAGDVRRLTDGLTEDQLARRTVPEKWSLKELVCHLRRVQEVFDGRIEAMSTRDQPEIASYEPEQDAEFPSFVARPARETIDGFVRERERLASRLESLTSADWARRGRHPEYPRYDVAFAAEYMTHHEAHHIYQMFQRRSLLEP